MFRITISIALTCFVLFSQFAFSEEKQKPSITPEAFKKTTETPKKTPDEQKAEQLLEQKPLIVTDKQLEEIIDKLPATDKATITNIQKEIADWPKSVFQEISNYREFVMTARKIAAEKYTNLSPEARQALEKEKSLKAELSPATLKLLETVQLSTVTKTN